MLTEEEKLWCLKMQLQAMEDVLHMGKHDLSTLTERLDGMISISINLLESITLNQ